MKTIYTKKIISAVTGLAAVASLAIAVPAFADTNVSGQVNVNVPAGAPGQWGMGQSGERGGMMGRGKMASSTRPMMARPTAMGKVTAINGSVITINSHEGFSSTTPVTVLTVDATNATVVKGNATSSVSSIVVGDTIVVQGTLSGTNVVATSIRDGAMRGPMGAGEKRGANKGGEGQPEMMGSSTMPMGNGQPVVAGTVSVVSGTSLTITTKSNVSYTVDASNAKILNGQQTATLSNISVGDTVLVQGTINGTSVVATSVVDQAHVSANGKAAPRGILGGIGQFFMHMFGF